MKMSQNTYICQYKISSSGDVQSKKSIASWPIKMGTICRVSTLSHHPGQDVAPDSSKLPLRPDIELGASSEICP